MRKRWILLTALVLAVVTGIPADGCEAARWEALIEAISGLETGTLDERIALADEIYSDEFLTALDNPPGGDRTLV